TIKGRCRHYLFKRALRYAVGGDVPERHSLTSSVASTAFWPTRQPAILLLPRSPNWYPVFSTLSNPIAYPEAFLSGAVLNWQGLAGAAGRDCCMQWHCVQVSQAAQSLEEAILSLISADCDADEKRGLLGPDLRILAPMGAIFQAVGFVRMERCPTQADPPPLVGLAAEKVIRDRGIWPENRLPRTARFPRPSVRGRQKTRVIVSGFQVRYR
ncbi:MAG: hypothetical protein R6U98_23755, partial [Pirellulaceae bacterium]